MGTEPSPSYSDGPANLGVVMYIGAGTLVVILLIVLIIYFLRRA